ncbi:MAG: NYN domain-containing protein [Planctomycetes bacterium]|nr:NYN domain-containing protein [Planctomycetota bacterium]
MAALKRSVVYIDGFNLYYGALKGGPHKWLDLERYFERLRPNDDIQVIRYFTAAAIGSAGTRQQVYLRALETLPLVDVVLGKFKNRRVTCRLGACEHSGSRVFSTREEKRTDVNIAVQILDDAYQDLCDRIIIVSGDSDLIPSINLVKRRFSQKEIIVYVPARDATRGAAVEIRAAADKHRLLPLNLLEHAQLPARVPNGTGGHLEKPVEW